MALMGFAPFALIEGCFPTPCQSPVSAKGEGAERKAREEARRGEGRGVKGAGEGRGGVERGAAGRSGTELGARQRQARRGGDAAQLGVDDPGDG